MSNRQRYNKRAIAESTAVIALSRAQVPIVPICHTPPDRPFITKKDVRSLGGHRKIKKQGKGTASNECYHPLIKPRLSARKTYRELEAMINPEPTFKVLGPFKIYD